MCWGMCGTVVRQPFHCAIGPKMFLITLLDNRTASVCGKGCGEGVVRGVNAERRHTGVISKVCSDQNAPCHWHPGGQRHI